MGELDDLRELMWSARQRWTTVRATLRERVDAGRAEEAFDRFGNQESPGSVARFGPEIELPPFLTKELRVWGRKPYRWRVETDLWNGDSYVEVGDRAWRSDLTYHGYGPEETDPRTCCRSTTSSPGCSTPGSLLPNWTSSDSLASPSTPGARR